MIELPALIALAESAAIPALAAFLSSEIIGLSKRTKSNSVLQLVFRILRAVAVELAEPPASPSVAPEPPQPDAPVDMPEPEQKPVKRRKTANRIGVRPRSANGRFAKA